MTENVIAKIVGDIQRGDPASLDSYIKTVEHAFSISGTKTIFYSHMIEVDGNGSARLDDFIDFIARHIIEYVIPRSRINAAKAKDALHSTTVHTVRLVMEAQSLFTPLEKTGEGGEMLLFVLGETLLKLPQLFCKMSVKTAAGVHFHGADGIHVGVGANENLELYWGESKFHSTFDSAIGDCLDSIEPILKRQNKADAEDLLLLQSHLDLDNPNYTAFFKAILDKDNKAYNTIEYCGICLIGFNQNLYASEITQEIIDKHFEDWKKSLKTRLKNRGLETIKIHFFCLPIECVDSFREKFLVRMGIKK